MKLIIEIKGYAAHVRDMDRQKYCNELNRETFLQAMGYSIISFAYDDVEKNAELCITMLRLVMSRYLPEGSTTSRIRLVEKEILRLAIQQAEPIRPKDVEIHFEVDHKTAVRWLQQLCARGWMLPAYGVNRARVIRYEIAPIAFQYL